MKYLGLILALIILFLLGCEDSKLIHNLPQPSEDSSTKEPSNQDKIVEQIKLEARKQTVIITGKSKGTGIIIAQDGYTHYVLTSKHIVGIAPSKDIQLPQDLGPDEKHLTNQGDPYKVVTFDGQNYQKYEIKYEEVEKDPNLDLAIIKFDSQSQDKKYTTAKLTTSPVSQKQTVYVYGLKDCYDKQIQEKEEFNKGTILSNSQVKTFDEGYSINYSNPTITGMSGSPVLDAAGRVVAIHGKPGKKNKDKEYPFEKCPKLTDYYGNNYGISMQAFKDSSLATKLTGKLAFDDKPIEVELTQNNKTNNKPLSQPLNSPRFIRSKPAE